MGHLRRPHKRLPFARTRLQAQARRHLSVGPLRKRCLASHRHLEREKTQLALGIKGSPPKLAACKPHHFCNPSKTPGLPHDFGSACNLWFRMVAVPQQAVPLPSAPYHCCACQNLIPSESPSSSRSRLCNTAPLDDAKHGIFAVACKTASTTPRCSFRATAGQAPRPPGVNTTTRQGKTEGKNVKRCANGPYRQPTVVHKTGSPPYLREFCLQPSRCRASAHGFPSCMQQNC